MTAFGLVRALFAVQVALAAAYGLARIVAAAPGVSARAKVATARALLVVACAAPLALPAPPPALRFAPPVQVWAAPRRVVEEAARPGAAVLSIGQVARGTRPWFDATWATWAAAAFAAIGVAWALVRVGQARRSLGRIVGRASQVRHVGRVRVLASGDVSTPFAARFGGAVVVLDLETYTGAERGIAARHELMHHRRGDPLFAHLALGLVAPSYVSPVARAWLSLLRDLDELACDEALLARGVPREAYGHALLGAALRGRGPLPALASALSAAASRALLARRLDAIAAPRPGSRARAAACGVLAAAVLVAVAGAAGGVAVDRRVDRREVEIAAARAEAAGLRVPLTPAVLAALDRLVATPDGRRFLRDALERRAALAAPFGDALAARGLPRAFTAVALVESGYQNLPARAPAGSSLAPGAEPGAGFWMFIPATARAYGLRVDQPDASGVDQPAAFGVDQPAASGVDGAVDERLDPAKETEAAARLLADLEAELQDHALALAAYNQGAAHVRRAITREGTRDAFELARRGALNGYGAAVLAAALVEANPALVRP